jgi:hypothetical protein
MPASLVGEGLACGGRAPPTVAVLDDAGCVVGAAPVVTVLVFEFVFELPVSCSEEQPPAKAAIARRVNKAKGLRMILSVSLKDKREFHSDVRASRRVLLASEKSQKLIENSLYPRRGYT